MRYSQILVENRRFNLPNLYLAPPLGVAPLEFRRYLWQQKTRRIALWCGVKISRFFGLVTKHGCDRRTDRQNYDSQDRASIAASRGKMSLWNAMDSILGYKSLYTALGTRLPWRSFLEFETCLNPTRRNVQHILMKGCTHARVTKCRLIHCESKNPL